MEQEHIEDAMRDTLFATAMADEYCQVIEEEIHCMYMEIENMIGQCY